jgi:hypothetical protein
LHGTVYIPDNTEWNENFATFVGEEGAKLFLQHKFGALSTQEFDYLDGKRAGEQRRNFMNAVSAWLRYQYMREDVADTTVMENIRKQSFETIERWANLKFTGKDSTFANSLARRMKQSGNTVFMSSLRYESQQDQFRKDFRTSGFSLRDYIKRLVISHQQN